MSCPTCCPNHRPHTLTVHILAALVRRTGADAVELTASEIGDLGRNGYVSIHERQDGHVRVAVRERQPTEVTR